MVNAKNQELIKRFKGNLSFLNTDVTAIISEIISLYEEMQDSTPDEQTTPARCENLAALWHSIQVIRPLLNHFYLNFPSPWIDPEMKDNFKAWDELLTIVTENK